MFLQWFYVFEEKTFENPTLCGNSSGALSCPNGKVCVQNPGFHNPDYGYTNYDTFGWSFLSTFRLANRDYWESLLHLVIASSGPWHVIGFIFIIIYVSFYLVAFVWSQIALAYKHLENSRWEKKLIENIDDEVSQKWILAQNLHISVSICFGNNVFSGRRKAVSSEEIERKE